MIEILFDNYLYLFGAAFSLLALLYLMFKFANFIPHILVATYFVLPLFYTLTHLPRLPLTTIFTLLLGPVVLWHSQKRAIRCLWTIPLYLLTVMFTSAINGVDLFEIKSVLIPIIISTLCMLSLSRDTPTAKGLTSFAYLIVGWISVNSMFSIFQIFLGRDFYVISATESTTVDSIQRGYGLIGMATQVGINFCLGVPLLTALLFDKHRKKLLLFPVFVLNVTGLLLSFSRGAIVGTILAISFVLYLHKRQKLLVACLVIGIASVFIYSSAIQLLPQNQQRFVQGKDGSAGARLPYVQIGLRMFADRPLTGWGYGGFSENCMRYGSPIKLEAHNTFVQVLVEYGILGFIAFLTMIGLSIRGYLGYIREGNSPAMRTLSIGFLAALIAIALDGLVHCLEWNLVFWLPVVSGFLMQHHRRLELYAGLTSPASRISTTTIQLEGHLA